MLKIIIYWRYSCIVFCNVAALFFSYTEPCIHLDLKYIFVRLEVINYSKCWHCDNSPAIVQDGTLLFVLDIWTEHIFETFQTMENP